MRKWWIIPVIMIATLIIGLIGAAWSQRPIIEYSFTDYPDTFDLQYGLMGVWLKIKNTGISYAKLNFVLTVKNANISLSEIKPSMEYNGTQLKIHYDLPSGMEVYDEHYVKIEPINNPENFTLELKIENLTDWSIPNGVIRQFLERHGYITHLEYNRTDTTTYELVP